jgi:hypothetical protein
MKIDPLKGKISMAFSNENQGNMDIFRAKDTSLLLGSLAQLGVGRIICCQGGLSLALAADFRRFSPNARDLPFFGGVLELTPDTLKVRVSKAACGFGLGISLFDHVEKLQLVFHFCHGSPWREWLEGHVESGLLQKDPSLGFAPADLCWCDLWPKPKAATFPMPVSLLESRFSTLTQSRTIETTISTQHLQLETIIHPSSFDKLASSVRFWDRPRTRVCYADLASLEPERHESYATLKS